MQSFLYSLYQYRVRASSSRIERNLRLCINILLHRKQSLKAAWSTINGHIIANCWECHLVQLIRAPLLQPGAVTAEHHYCCLVHSGRAPLLRAPVAWSTQSTITAAWSTQSTITAAWSTQWHHYCSQHHYCCPLRAPLLLPGPLRHHLQAAWSTLLLLPGPTQGTITAAVLTACHWR